MAAPDQLVTYTADRRAWRAEVAPWAFIFALEGGVWAVLIAVIVGAVWLRIALLAALIGAALLVLLLMSAPCFTRHRLTPENLELRFGRDQFSIPRSRIAAARAAEAVERPVYSSRTRLIDEGTGLALLFSASGAIRLTLDPPLQIERDGLPRTISSILLNVDDADSFLTALGVPETATKGRSPAAVAMRPTAHAADRPREIGRPVIVADHLTRMFEERVAVRDLELTVHAGESYGFLGPNGAGKTTTIKMLVGLLAPTRGRVSIAGRDLATDELNAKRAYGYVPDRAILYERLTGREFLAFLAQMRRMDGAAA